MITGEKSQQEWLNNYELLVFKIFVYFPRCFGMVGWLTTVVLFGGLKPPTRVFGWWGTHHPIRVIGEFPTNIWDGCGWLVMMVGCWWVTFGNGKAHSCGCPTIHKWSVEMLLWEANYGQFLTSISPSLIYVTCCHKIWWFSMLQVTNLAVTQDLPINFSGMIKHKDINHG